MKTKALKWILGITGVVVISYLVVKYLLPVLTGLLALVGLLSIGIVIYSVLKSKGIRKGGNS